MRFLLNTLWVTAIAAAVVYGWHVSTDMDPLEQNLAIQVCASSARMELEVREPVLST